MTSRGLARGPSSLARLSCLGACLGLLGGALQAQNYPPAGPFSSGVLSDVEDYEIVHPCGTVSAYVVSPDSRKVYYLAYPRRRYRSQVYEVQIDEVPSSSRISSSPTTADPLQLSEDGSKVFYLGDDLAPGRMELFAHLVGPGPFSWSKRPR